jgi:hypothetical protein
MRLALRADDEHFPPRAIDTMLTATCAASVMQLAVGKNDLEDTLPLRGGIDVGVGISVDGDVFTAGLAKAVDLEQNADYPRVIVGERFTDYLQSLADMPGSDPTARYTRTIAEFDQSFVFVDPVDEKPCLDFIGSAFRRRSGDGSIDLVRDAWLFVQKAMAFHAANPRLRRKYEWLAAYFTSRLSLWGL